MQLIILAAGKSQRIFNKIKINKCLIRYKQKTLIEKIITESKKYFKVTNIVVGFNHKLITRSLKKYTKINFIKNIFYDTKEMLFSIVLALKKINDDVVISYSDIIVSNKIWSILKKESKDCIMIPTSKNWRKVWKKRKKNIYDDAETLKTDRHNNLIEIGKKIKKGEKIKSQFMGIIFIPKDLIKPIIKIYNENKFEKYQTTQFLQILIKRKFKIKCIETNLYWYEIDDLMDLNQLKINK